jgi:phage FluMu protein Com
VKSANVKTPKVKQINGISIVESKSGTPKVKSRKGEAPKVK